MTIIQSLSNSPTFNLAAEEFLFSEKQDDLLFLYVNEPSVIIGSNQAVANEVDLEFCKDNSIRLVRRMSGGGAVYHDEGNLNYCFIKNKITGESTLSGDFLKPIIVVLRELKLNVQKGKRKDLWLPGAHKISGTASHIGKTRELHHGTLLYDSDLEKLDKSLTSKSTISNARAIFSVHSPVKNIKSYLKENNFSAPSTPDFFDQFVQKLLDYYNLDKISFLDKTETPEIIRLQETKYELSEWTFRK